MATVPILIVEQCIGLVSNLSPVMVPKAFRYESCNIFVDCSYSGLGKWVYGKEK